MKVDCSYGNHNLTEIDLALCRATIYSALALGFRAPTKETISRIVEPKNSAALADAAAYLDVDGRQQLVPAIEAAAGAGRAGLDALASSYHLLFGHTARGPIPPYETEYGDEALFQQPQEMGDLTGFYRAFGLVTKVDAHERCDHISCECEFLSFLALKEAYALEHQDQSMLAEVRKAVRLFLKDHLGRFVPAFATRLSREDRAGFYGALGTLCLRFADLESRRLKIPLGAFDLALRPENDDRVPMACGSGAECAAVPGGCETEELDSV